ncbi:MAG TPA: stage V sporulation protein T, partial [Clostridium sp.]|nr:stage V sporulation protein T [Clostridium sp.]
EGRRAVIYGTGAEKTIPLYEDEDETVYSSQVVSPIVAEGDAIGAVVILSKEENVKFGDLELKLAETASAFLGKQMEQ